VVHVHCETVCKFVEIMHRKTIQFLPDMVYVILCQQFIPIMGTDPDLQILGEKCQKIVSGKSSEGNVHFKEFVILFNDDHAVACLQEVAVKAFAK